MGSRALREDGASLYLLSSLLDEEEEIPARDAYLDEEDAVEVVRTGFESSSESEEKSLTPDLAYDLASLSFDLLSLSILLQRTIQCRRVYRES